MRGGDNSVQDFGAEAEGEEFAQAAQTLHDFLDARAQRAWAAACAALAPAVATSLQEAAEGARAAEGGTCAAGLRAMTRSAAIPQLRAEAQAADVVSLRAENDRGFILYRGQEQSIWAIPVADDNGAWKVAALAGLQLN